MNRVASFFEERFDLGGLKAVLAKKTIPHHPLSWLYYSGGILLFLLGLQIVTGTLLLAQYRPGEETSFESIVHLVSKVPLGVYLRSFHSHAASLMVLVCFFHLFTIMFYKGYRAPRELTWVTGFFLLVMTMAFGFSGYLLPWDMISLAATKIGTDAPKAMGPPGAILSLWLRGGEDVTGVTIGRFFALHVWGLPLFFLPLVGIHLFFVQLQGVAVPPSIERRGKSAELPFFPNVLYRDLIVWLLLLGLLITLSVLVPSELGAKADPMLPTPEDIKPEWYFLFAFQTLKLFPALLLGIPGESIAIALMAMLGLAACLWPFIDRKAHLGKTPVWIRPLPFIGVGYFIFMTVWGWLA
jgi:cytochrome b6